MATPPGEAETTRLAVFVPADIGLKATVITHVPMGLSVAQPFWTTKSAALVPVMMGVMPPLSLPPLFVIVIVVAGEAVDTAMLPKSAAWGDAEIVGD